jgi:uncharacterized caspase-like protein/Tol biopolymer transport system component
VYSYKTTNMGPKRKLTMSLPRRFGVLLIAVLSFSGLAWASDTPLIGAHAVQIWSSATGIREQSIDESSPVFNIAFSPDGRKLATAGQNGISIWDIATGRRIWQAGEAALSVVFAPNGKVVAEVVGSAIRLQDAATGLSLGTFAGATADLNAVVFSRDGRRLAMAGEDNAVRVFDLATSHELWSFAGHNSTVGSLTFSPDAKFLASADYEGIVRIWSLTSGQEIRRFRRNQESAEQGLILALAISPDGRMLAAGGSDHICTLWDVSAGKEIAVLRGHSYAVTSVTFDVQNQKLIVVTGSLDHSVRFWDSATGQELKSITTSQGPVSAIAFSGDGKHIATATNFSEIGAEEKTLYVVGVGINNYQDRDQLRLRYSVADATAIAEAFRNGAAGVFNRTETRLLLDATKIEIIRALRQIEDKARPTDTLVFFFAGHVAEEVGSEPILLPADGVSGTSGGRKFTGIGSSELLRILARMPIQHQLILLDTTDAGSVFHAMDRGILQQNPNLLELMDRSVAVIGSTQRSSTLEDAPIGHSLLTSAVLAGLSGEAAESAAITARSLFSYAKEHVNAQVRGGEQFAYFLSGRDFPLGRIQSATKHLSGTEERNDAHRHAHAQSPLPVKYEPAALRLEADADRGVTVANVSPITALPPRHDYALIFAGTHYEKNTGWPTLTYPQRDAEAVRDLLHNQYGFQVEIVPDADEDTILSKLREYRTKRTFGPEDQLLVMFAGHGAADDVDGYVVAKNSKVSDENFTTYISFSNLRTILDNMAARHVLLVLDTCFDGAFEPRYSSRRSSALRFQPVLWSAEVQSHLAFLTTHQPATAASGTREQASSSSTAQNAAERAEFIHSKLRYTTRWYLVSGGREPVPDQSVFIQKFLASLRALSIDEGVLTAQQIYGAMQRIKPQPHQSGFGKNEPWSDFIFEVRDPEEANP